MAPRAPRPGVDFEGRLEALLSRGIPSDGFRSLTFEGRLQLPEPVGLRLFVVSLPLV